MRWFVLASATLGLAFADSSTAHAFGIKHQQAASGYYGASAPVAPLNPNTVAAVRRFGRFGYAIAQQVLGVYGIHLPNINLPNPPAQHESAKVSPAVFQSLDRSQATLSNTVTKTNELLELVRQNDKRFKVQNIGAAGSGSPGNTGNVVPGGTLTEMPQPRPE